MPELPEVETISNELRAKIRGRRIKSISARIPNFIHGRPALVRGLKIVEISRRAKNIHVELSDNRSMILHLKMTGQLIFDNSSPRKKLDPHTRAVIEFTDRSRLLFRDVRRFGYLKIMSRSEAEAALAHYGPEPLRRTFTPPELGKILARYPKSKMKPFLLDQRKVAGLGNIYTDEILNLARIHPLSLVGTLGRARAEGLYTAIRRVLRRAVRLGGSSLGDYVRTDGSLGRYGQVRRVYNRAGEACPNRCGGKIGRMVVAGRGTYYCPKCQRIRR